MANPTDRLAAAEAVYARLFGPREATAAVPDPEFGEILRRLIFGDVFATGELDDRTRELVTVTCLGSLQTLPQLRAHAAAALRVGVTPVELREAMYQLAAFAGFPRALNAITVLNEVLRESGIELPLPEQATVRDDERHQRGLILQEPQFASEVADALAGLPPPFDTAVPAFLTDHLFGDFWTRRGLEIADRELLALIALAALGHTAQLPAHVHRTLAAGNPPERVLAALVQAFPYVGFPAALNTIREVQAQIATCPPAAAD